jgi:hypothetical protein
VAHLLVIVLSRFGSKIFERDHAMSSDKNNGGKTTFLPLQRLSNADSLMTRVSVSPFLLLAPTPIFYMLCLSSCWP